MAAQYVKPYVANALAAAIGNGAIGGLAVAFETGSGPAAIMLNALVNCLKEHEKEKLLSHSITTAMPFD
jgi:hypothetical protein